MRERADARTEAALAAAAIRDPREFYRERLRTLRERDPAAFARAVAYFEETLIPRAADPGEDAVAAWLDYGRYLAELVAPGRTVEIDRAGRATPAGARVSADRLVLHLPHDAREAALLVSLPRDLSAPQRASYDLLVAGRTEIRNGA